MKIADYNLFETCKTQPSRFIFYPLTYKTIEEFREDEERYFMFCEDEKNSNF